MKLELKHVAAYFPYELKAFVTDERLGFGDPFLDRITGIYEDLITFNDSPDWYFDSEENYTGIKLALRPLSDLTKEIEHNGKTFIPFIELAKIEAGVHKSETSTQIEDEGYAFYVEYLPSWFGLYFNKNTKMFSKWDDGEGKDSCDNDLREKLLEWHFDLFDLIEHNLAVDINTLDR